MNGFKRGSLSERRFRGAIMVCALIIAMNITVMPVKAAESCYPKCSASCDSLVDALKSVGADASFSSRKTIAIQNDITDYSGTAAQNIRLLNLLKSGTLRQAEYDAAASAAPLDANLSKVQYIPQAAKTCKATALAMAVNLLRGTDACTTAGMGGSCCGSIEGQLYTGSDGSRYAGTYRTDSYVGSAGELTGVIEAALTAGVPCVAAVHSTAGGTRHHWVVVVGRSGDDYLIVDPAYGASGSMAANTVTLSARNYAFGLTDYASTHYGYVTFSKS